MCIFNVFPVGVVCWWSRLGTRERAYTSGPCGLVTHVLYLTHGPHGMSAEHVPTPALTHIGLRPTRTQKLQLQKKSGDKHIYIYIYIYRECMHA